MTEPMAIGGVLPADQGRSPAEDSVFNFWRQGWSQFSAFGTARSAVRAALRHRSARRAWLPAYACTALEDGARGFGGEICLFPCDRKLSIDVNCLSRGLRPGDAVIGIDYFGRSADLAALAREHPEVLWVEDRAQALDPGVPAWGDIVVYSPRKIIGVADGGLLYSQDRLPHADRPPRDDVWLPEDARALDPDGHDPASWRPLFQRRETAFYPDDTAATDRTHRVLQSAPRHEISAIRKANWNSLAASLGDFALWPEAAPDFVPLAFPILVQDAAETVAALAANDRIWAPRHWADLPKGASEFSDAIWLSNHCVSLPLDQRYGEAEMQRIARAVSSVARPAV